MIRFAGSLTVVFLLGISGCGGGGGGGSNSGPGGNIGGSGWVAGVFKPVADYVAKCAAPRSGNDPDGHPWPDVSGAALDEKLWLRSWTHDLYLWYSEVPDVNPASYTVLDYFDVLRTTATTSSGHDKDKFHFTYSTDQWIALSQSGIVVGYGLQWSVISQIPPREVVVAYTDPGSPATTAPASLARGAHVLAIDGVDIDDGSQSGVDTLNAGLAPSADGETHTFTIRDLGSASTRSVSLTAGSFPSTPVQHVHTIDSGGGRVGYLLFNDHIATAESELIDAVTTLGNAGIDDLVLDIRYNGGGYLAIASELAYMIAGNAVTTGRTFEQLQFNDKNPTTNPVTHRPLTPVPFFSTSQDFSGPAGVSLPALNLPRVFVLTGPNTCSASESIINSLRGVDVEVIQIGSATCGKPYGFYPQDNCGTTYFSIEFRGVNDKGFGEYTDGFTPVNSTVAASVSLPGCSVADDFTHELGDAGEGRLAVALNYRLTGACSVPPSGFGKRKAGVAASLSAVDGIIHKSPWHENRILRRL